MYKQHFSVNARGGAHHNFFILSLSSANCSCQWQQSEKIFLWFVVEYWWTLPLLTPSYMQQHLTLCVTWSRSVISYIILGDFQTCSYWPDTTHALQLKRVRCGSFSASLQRGDVLLTDVEVIGWAVVRLPHGLPNEQPHGFSVVLWTQAA